MQKEYAVIPLSEGNVLEEGRLLIHPVRFAIIKYLLDNEGAYVSQITSKLGNPIDRRLVSFHLNKLEKHDFVQGTYEISKLSKSKGRAIKRYFLTSRVHDVLSKLCETVEKTRDKTAETEGEN